MDSIVLMIQRLTTNLGVHIPRSILEANFEQHPDHPSLLSISDVLSDLGIENKGYLVPNEKLNMVPSPYIAHLSNDRFVVVLESDNNELIFVNEGGKKVKATLDQFSESFSGHILKASTGKENENKVHFRKTKLKDTAGNLVMPVSVFGLLFVFLYFSYLHGGFWAQVDWKLAVLSCLKLVGVAVSSLLVVESLNQSNSVFGKMCVGENVDCKKVLSSKAAKILGKFLTWADIGFLYFSSTLAVLLFCNIDNFSSTVFLVCILNVLALPYTIFSIYYQKFKVKKWCGLCLIVQLVLWSEFICGFSFLFADISFLQFDLLNFFIIAFIPLLIWMLVKPALMKMQQIKPLKERLRKFKSNSSVFKKLVNEGERFNLLDAVDSIIMGDSHDRTVTIVINPACPHCGSGLSLLNNWRERYQRFALQIVFFSEQDKPLSDITQLVLSLRDKPDLCVDLLTHWYENDLEELKKLAIESRPYQADKRSVEKAAFRQSEWCNLIKLDYTPTVLIDGRKVPDLFEIEELKYHLI